MQALIIKESLRRSLAARRLPVAAIRLFSGDTRKLDEKEKGDERVYFRKKEGKKPIITM